MHGSGSDHLSPVPFRSRANRRDGAACVRDPDAGSVQLADSTSRVGNGCPRPAGKGVRHLPVLEATLQPFAGPRARWVAELLLRRFGSIRQIGAAPEALLLQALADAPDIAAAIILGRSLKDISAREQLTGAAFNIRDPAFHRFLVSDCNHPTEERCYSLYLDAAGRFLNIELVGTGSVSTIQVAFRPLFARTIELGAAGLVIVHNHPSGTAEPSHDDIAATRQIAQLASALAIRLVDHLIVGGTRVYSMNEAGLL